MKLIKFETEQKLRGGFYTPKPIADFILKWAFNGSDHCQDKKMLKLVNKVLKSGHLSTIEHCQFVFSISGVSRACTHQLTRHRHASFSMKSQRYVTEIGQFEYVVPESIREYEKNDGKFNAVQFHDLMIDIQKMYNHYIKNGIPAEDARFILPNAATSSMVASLNLRELIHLANLRLCNKAQHEIRKVVKKMCEIAIGKEPWLKDYLVPKCIADGRCKEIRPCGKTIK